MTDEELLAEEYICNGKCQDDITKDYSHCKTCTRLNDFLAGLKAGSQLDRVWHDYDAGEDCYEDSHEGRWVEREAGRPKWHKVADGDLPDNTDNVLSDKGVIVYYNFTHACWVDERASVEIDDVIAWCEVPQYTEE